MPRVPHVCSASVPVSLTLASHCQTFEEVFARGPYFVITIHCLDTEDHGPTECRRTRHTVVKEPAPPPTVQVPAHQRAYTALRGAALAFPGAARALPAKTRALGRTVWHEAVGVCKEMHADARSDMELMAAILIDTVEYLLYLLLVRR